MKSTLIFDITQAGYKSYFFPAQGLIFVVIGAGMIYFHLMRKRKKDLDSQQKKSRPGPWFLFAYFGFACLWTVFSFKSTYTDYSDLRSAFEQGQCKLVEGKVKNFLTGVKEKGRAEESFDIDDAHFSYSHRVVTAGFNTPVADGGPMKEGLHVRVHHCGRQIARLEIVGE
ncbi:hypothetical protein [Undibacterium pigrum]|uniref:Uncharacterized protein n=1 Tax=Undibacterium pigrum TaxID=401470 RepID=A0A318IN78_9BURK|nr:hypothetical protein [Undibacterium pigrum]PXX34937.1 hypothetical protein DFR42_12416 [Undibacterium pigrum]